MTPGWFGERLDLGYAIDVLHPLATGERIREGGISQTLDADTRVVEGARFEDDGWRLQ